MAVAARKILTHFAAHESKYHQPRSSMRMVAYRFRFRDNVRFILLALDLRLVLAGLHFFGILLRRSTFCTRARGPWQLFR